MYKIKKKTNKNKVGDKLMCQFSYLTKHWAIVIVIVIINKKPHKQRD